MTTVWELVGLFIFIYPIALSVIWVVCGLYFWRRREPTRAEMPEVEDEWPPVTILVPMHNEEKVVESTCRALAGLNYPRYRVVFVDDASQDGTVSRLRKAIADQEQFYLLRLNRNVGKAGALNAALSTVVSTPLIMTIDADTVLAPDALKWCVYPFTVQPRLGAVTGNPLVYNRDTLVERLQVAEFASIIGLIKRAQRVLGRITTVSGCVTAFRTEVLREVGGFSPRVATEDIDVTWRIHKHFYQVWFEPRALAHIQAPPTLGEYFRQRCRWAVGGWQLLHNHRDIFASWNSRRLWSVYLEFSLSYLWALCFVLGTVLWCVTTLAFGVGRGFSPIPGWYGALISLACLVQFGASLLVNHQYDRTMWRSFFWVPWYPLFFFAVNALAVVRTAPVGIRGDFEDVGRWESPQRLGGYNSGDDKN